MCWITFCSLLLLGLGFCKGLWVHYWSFILFLLTYFIEVLRAYFLHDTFKMKIENGSIQLAYLATLFGSRDTRPTLRRNHNNGTKLFYMGPFSFKLWIGVNSVYFNYYYFIFRQLRLGSRYLENL